MANIQKSTIVVTTVPEQKPIGPNKICVKIFFYVLVDGDRCWCCRRLHRCRMQHIFFIILIQLLPNKGLKKVQTTEERWMEKSSRRRKKMHLLEWTVCAGQSEMEKNKTKGKQDGKEKQQHTKHINFVKSS